MRERPAGAAVMKASTAYPAAIAANQAPTPTCLFSESVVCRMACSTGPSSAAAASTASSQRSGASWRVAQLVNTAHRASTMTTPVQDQACSSTVSEGSLPGARSSVVCVIPVR